MTMGISSRHKRFLDFHQDQKHLNLEATNRGHMYRLGAAVQHAFSLLRKVEQERDERRMTRGGNMAYTRASTPGRRQETLTLSGM
ncbi:hypothetical protein BDW02DRAFT_570994, partial [Decorospora gaudefroyi]